MKQYKSVIEVGLCAETMYKEGVGCSCTIVVLKLVIVQK